MRLAVIPRWLRRLACLSPSVHRARHRTLRPVLEWLEDRTVPSTTAAATATFQSNGEATFSTSALPVGAHTVVATYSGDTAFAASTSNTVSEAINATSATTAMFTAATVNKKHQVTVFTVTVTSASGTPTSGTVTLKIPGKRGSISAKNAIILKVKSSMVSLGSDGTATFTLILKKPVSLSKPIFAVYSGDTQFAGSVSGPFSARDLP